MAMVLLAQALSGTDFYTFYAAGLRAPLFTGFFTLSSFLLAAKAFIVINLKKEVYESDTYKARLEELRQVTPDLTSYGGLIRLSRLLVFTISCALITSTLQLTLGLVEKNWAAYACVGFALFTLIVVFFAVNAIRRNIKTWLTQLEKDAAAKRKAEAEARIKAGV
jgi:hypothetical protein